MKNQVFSKHRLTSFIIIILLVILISPSCSDLIIPRPQIGGRTEGNDSGGSTSAAPRSVVGRTMDILNAVHGTISDVNQTTLYNMRPGDIVRQSNQYTEHHEYIETSKIDVRASKNEGLSVGFGPVGFSGGIGNSSSTSGERYVVEFITRSIVESEFASGGTSPSYWAARLSEQGIYDFFNLNSSSFLDKNGNVTITHANYGIFAFMDFSYFGSTLANKSQVSAGLKAMYNGISGGYDWSNSTDAVELQTRSIFSFYTCGGIADFMSTADFYIGYKDWFARASQNPVYVGSPNNSYLPHYQVFMAYADLNPGRADEIRQRAEALRKEMYERAFNKAEKLNWLTVHTREFSAVGNDRFFLPAADNTLRQFMIYVFGASGGGQGSALSGTITRTYYPGAGGGSGAGVRFGFITSDDVDISFYVGKGGDGGGFRNTQTGNRGYSGDSGGASWVAYNGITMSAGGGQGGGEPGSRTGGAGGSASSNPGSQFNQYLRLDGHRGSNGGPGAGGAPVSIDGFIGSTGGRGSSQSSGSAGSNGRIVIRSYSLD